MFEKPVNTPLVRARLAVNAGLSRLSYRLAGVTQRQVVVCGFPRSGTSLLYNMLSSSLPDFRFEPFEQYFIYRIHRLGNYATKAPMDVFHVPWIDELNINKKKLTVLIVIRDLRDVVTSKHPILPGHYFIGYDHSWWPQDHEFKAWDYDAPGLMEIYGAINAIISRPDTTVVRYEDLVSNPDEVQQKIASTHGLEFQGQFNDYHRRPEKHAYKYEGRYAPADTGLVLEGRKSTSSRVERWRTRPEDTQRVIDQFRACDRLFDILEELGYEKNRSWFDRLL